MSHDTARALTLTLHVPQFHFSSIFFCVRTAAAAPTDQVPPLTEKSAVATLARAASSSEGIEQDDLRVVATAIVKRLGSGVPLKPAAFEEFSAAIERMLAATAAAS